jgi:hypothetical protein
MPVVSLKNYLLVFSCASIVNRINLSVHSLLCAMSSSSFRNSVCTAPSEQWGLETSARINNEQSLEP